MKEQWKTIKGYKSFYDVSNFGRVRGWRNGRYGRRIKPRIKKLTLNPYGYYQTGIRINGKSTNFYVHRLVAEAFIPNPENKPEVNHIDCDKINNRADNLEWCTHEENLIHASKMGVLKGRMIGEDVPASKLKEKDVISIRDLYHKGFLQKDIAKKFNVSKSLISKVVRKDIWKHI